MLKIKSIGDRNFVLAVNSQSQLVLVDEKTGKLINDSGFEKKYLISLEAQTKAGEEVASAIKGGFVGGISKLDKLSRPAKALVWVTKKTYSLSKLVGFGLLVGLLVPQTRGYVLAAIGKSLVWLGSF